MTSDNTKTMTGNKRRISTSRRDVLRLGGTAAAAAATLALPARPSLAAGKKLLRIAVPAPVTHGWYLWANHFKGEIEKSAGNSVEVKIFPDAQMGNERDTAQAVKLGSLEMGTIGVGLMNWVPEMSVTDTPFLWKSRQQSINAFDGAFGAELKKRSAAKGFRLVGWTDLGFRCMTNTVRRIKSAADMKGMKMRVPNSKSYIAMIQALGATTVAVDLSELYLALRQGIADGQDTPAPVVKSNRLYEVQKYVSKTEHVLTTAYAVANPKMYDSLGPDQKVAFDAACKSADDFLRKYTVDDEAAVYDFLGKQGMEVTLDVDGESFRKATASVVTSNPDLFPPDLVEMARATAV